MCNKLFLGTLLLLIVGFHTLNVQAGTVNGDLSKWAPMTIDFAGPSASETSNSPNPFLDYRLTVAMTSPNGTVHQVPGFFAGDGNSGATGNVWRVRFAADHVGLWRYQASLQSGSEIAIDTDLSAGTAVEIEAASGEFSISQHSSEAPGFLSHGRLEYTGEHYLKFRDGPYWIKSGTDSPENFLGYTGIDGTVDQGGSNFLHDYSSHRADARGDDPVFSNASSGADSLGITGALNYLSDQGVNSIYFLPMNLGGDGQETYPFIGGEKSRYNKTHFDISKLFQWNQVLAHAQRRGIALNIQLSETEPANEKWLDEGKMGLERKLFFRELIARFGYLLAAKWNLGEENDFPVSELREQASYLNELDWTKKPIAVHTQINNFRDYEELVGNDLFSASSIQYDPPRADEFVETWRKRSADAGRRWVIDMDENTGGITNNNADTRRKQILYDVYFSGGNLEWYYGYHDLPLGGDLTAGDFRLRDAIWTTMRHARNFMESQLPFWRMQPTDELVTGEADSFGGAEVFSAAGEIYAIYLPNASGNPTLNLGAASGSFSQQWFNPRNGQFEGDTKTIVGGENVSLGAPPSSSNDDWVVLVKSHNAPALPDFSVAVPPIAAEQPSEDVPSDIADEEPTTDTDGDIPDENPTTDTDGDIPDENPTTDTDGDIPDEDNTDTDSSSSEPQQENKTPVFLDLGELPAADPGQLYSFSVTATDAEGVAPIVTAETLPPGMQFVRVADGVASLEWQVPTDITEAVAFDLLAIDAQDRSMITTLNVAITVNVVTAEPTVTTQNTDSSTDDTSVIISDSMLTMLTSVIDLPPFIIGAEDSRAVVGQVIQKTVMPIDPEGIVASLRLDTELPNIELIDNGNGSRELVWTPEATDIGTHELRFIATDSGETPHVVQQLMKLEVIASTDSAAADIVANASIDTNNLPIFVPLAQQEIRSGDTISFIVKPIDPDGSVPIVHVSALPQGARFSDNGDGSRTFSWSVPDDYTGELSLTFIATDDDNLNATVEMDVMIKVLP